MAINYPGSVDSFNVPTDPEDTPLSEAGTSTRNHVELHQDTAAAVVALEQNAMQLAHDHSGDPTNPLQGTKLTQANTHQSVDTDSTINAIHHTIGTGGTQAAPGNHTHDYNGSSIYNQPVRICTSTTRPLNPPVGLKIWETDTNCERVWAAFPGNTLSPGMSFIDTFNRVSGVVSYDATGSGGSGIGVNGITGTHLVGSGAGILVVAVTVFNNSRPAHSSWTVTAAVGTTPMTQVTAQDNGASLTGFLVVFYLLAPPTGEQTITINATPNSGSFTAAMTMESVSYNNVSAITNVQQDASNLGFGLSVYVPSSAGDMVFGAMSGGLGNVTQPTQTQRAYIWPANNYCSMLVEDAPGGIGVPSQHSGSVPIGVNNNAFSGAAIGFNMVVASATLGAGYSQAYVTGSSPVNGSLATPTSGVAQWIVGQNIASRCIAVPLTSGDIHTLSNDQDFQFTTGTPMPNVATGWGQTPTVDIYARRSDDGQSYVRLALGSPGAWLFYTTSGPDNEIQLGFSATGTGTPNIAWEFKVVNDTFILYRGSIQVMSIVDEQNLTEVGSGYRGWAWGMSSVQAQISSNGQIPPCTVTSLSVNDLPIYTTTQIWQLLNTGAIPRVRAETHVGQQIAVNTIVDAFFDTILEDAWNCFGRGSISNQTTIAQTTDVVLPESGHYTVSASVPWDPTYYGFDHAQLGFTVNGQDIGRNTLQFLRGNGYAPGFAQTLNVSTELQFAAGDVLRVVVSHNANSTSWLYYNGVSPNKQCVWLDLKFNGP